MWLRSGQIRLVSWDVRNWQYLPTNEPRQGMTRTMLAPSPAGDAPG
jgi:hypothetical protein